MNKLCCRLNRTRECIRCRATWCQTCWANALKPNEGRTELEKLFGTAGMIRQEGPCVSTKGRKFHKHSYIGNGMKFKGPRRAV